MASRRLMSVSCFCLHLLFMSHIIGCITASPDEANRTAPNGGPHVPGLINPIHYPIFIPGLQSAFQAGPPLPGVPGTPFQGGPVPGLFNYNPGAQANPNMPIGAGSSWLGLANDNLNDWASTPYLEIYDEQDLQRHKHNLRQRLEALRAKGIRPPPGDERPPEPARPESDRYGNREESRNNEMKYADGRNQGLRDIDDYEMTPSVRNRPAVKHPSDNSNFHNRNAKIYDKLW